MSITASIVVCVPGGMSRAPTRTSVQPHFVRVSTMWTSWSSRFTSRKLWRIFDPRATVPKSNERSGKILSTHD